MNEFNPTTLHDYVVAHGYGSPTMPAFKLGKVMWRQGTHEYATIANEVVFRGYTVLGQLDKTVNRQLVECAAALMGGGPNYDRGLVELVCEYIELGPEHAEEVREAIREQARTKT